MKYTIQLFPEGGDLIADIDNRVAFLMTDQSGMPASGEGTLYEDDQPVTSFKTVHDGMGYFHIKPALNRSYKVSWRDEKNIEHNTAIPPVKPSGLSLQITEKNNKKLFVIRRTPYVPEAYKNLHVLGTFYGHIVFTSTISMESDALAMGMIPTEKMPTGILTVSVFDANWNALAERILFVNNHEYSFPLAVTPVQQGLGHRARNELKITVPDNIEANLSVSITDEALTSNTTNIINHLLLTSEVKGYIHNPSFYFGNSDSATNYLDLVMLTHGWRRFRWEDMAAGKLPEMKYGRDSNYLFLAGKIVEQGITKFKANDNIMIMSKPKDSSMEVSVLPIQENGMFADPAWFIIDTVRLYYQVQSSMMKKGSVRFLNSLLPSPDSAQDKSLWLKGQPGDTSGYYHHYYLVQQQLKALGLLQGKTLEMVTVRAKAKSPLQLMEEKYTSGYFRGGDAIQLDLVHNTTLQSYFDILSLLRSYAPRYVGLLGTIDSYNYYNNNSNGPTISDPLNYQFSNRTHSNMAGSSIGNSLVYLDESQVHPSFLSSIPLSDIAYIKVFQTGFPSTKGGSGPAIAVYTRKAEDLKNSPKGVSYQSIVGYTPAREFYAPDYSTPPQFESRPDLRTTLYWNPLLTTDPNEHTATVVFYNNDVTKAYHVVIEGISKDGQLTHYEKVIQ